MRLTAFKKIANKSGCSYLNPYLRLVTGGKIIEKRKDSDRRIVVAIDNRTFIENGTFHIYPIAAFGRCCFIICPLCGEIHTHGNVNGYRVPHCYDFDLRKREYFIEEMQQVNTNR
ncbi:MAG: hypothetical protein GX286_07050 [Clostridiales bacterium]|jgi:hypothetical protein|nr:hypothetical protein [Clostridiales bacterium]